MNSNSTNVTTTTKAPRMPLLKSQIARILGLNRSEQLMTYGYIDQEVLKIGNFPNLTAYKRRHLLLIPVVEAIFKKDNVTWDAKLNL